jgi:hypothetical protein
MASAANGQIENEGFFFLILASVSLLFLNRYVKNYEGLKY